MSTDDPFYAQIGPAREALESLIETSRVARQSYGGRPSPTSPAMAELAQEQHYRAGWGQEPVAQAHTAAHLDMALAEDTALAMCRDLREPPGPIWSWAVLNRSCIEASARARGTAARSGDI